MSTDDQSRKKINKEASWLYAELKSHISFQILFVAYLKLSDETWNEMCYLKLLKLLKLETFETRCAIWNFLKLFETFETFEMKCTIWNFWNFWNLLKSSKTFVMRCAIWNLAYVELKLHISFQISLPPTYVGR